MTLSSTTMELHAQPDVQPMIANRIVIVADDLTGACDSGVAFLRGGRRVRVALDLGGSDGQSSWDAEVMVFTTETRDASAEQAIDLVAQRVHAFGTMLDGALFFKKVDSAARGNFAVEISASLDASGVRLALVAPAFPSAGRTMERGVLTVRDWSGQDGSVSLRERFGHEPSAGVEVLPAGPVQQLEQGIARALEAETRILLCDATAHVDLERLAAAGLRVGSPLLWAGSAGLAHALAGELPVAAEQTATRTARRGRTILFAGTPHPVTTLQIEYLAQVSGEGARAMERIPEAGASEQQVVDAFRAEPVGALILTGGDTAAFVLRALGAATIDLAGEVARGIPWGFVEGGMADGCVVVTKSGGFGERDALAQAFEFCERRSCEPA
ncbi:MAG TPA: four-carbon acid sugar kinase family protein [Acidobacteriaceae bacterium]|jgi:uncharacterized protein YgbK (DUF1537 family)